jgi:hypothetical protein
MGPGWAPVAHAYNPSYSGGRDQEDHHSNPILANSSQDPISKISNTKRGGGVAQGVGPEFKLQYHKKKKKWGLKACCDNFGIKVLNGKQTYLLWFPWYRDIHLRITGNRIFMI